MNFRISAQGHFVYCCKEKEDGKGSAYFDKEGVLQENLLNVLEGFDEHAVILEEIFATLQTTADSFRNIFADSF